MVYILNFDKVYMLLQLYILYMRIALYVVIIYRRHALTIYTVSIMLCQHLEAEFSKIQRFMKASSRLVVVVQWSDLKPGTQLSLATAGFHFMYILVSYVYFH